MLPINTILSLIRKPKATATEIRAAIATIDTKPAEAEVEKLEAERRSLLLKDGADQDIEALEGKIRASNREIERLDAAKAELQRRLPDAEARELVAELEQRAAEARRTHDDILRRFVELDAVAIEVCRLLAAIEAGRTMIRAANNFVVKHGRSDLKSPFPEYTLAAHVGAASPVGIPHFEEWRLHGYRTVAWGNDVSLPLPVERRLGRAKELL